MEVESLEILGFIIQYEPTKKGGVTSRHTAFSTTDTPIPA